MNQALIDLGDYLVSALPEHLSEPTVVHDELCVTTSLSGLLKVLAFLRDDTECQFKQLSDICGVDYPDREPRFEVVYHLLGHRHNRRIRIKLRVNEDTLVPSATGIYRSAGWFEREVWDFFGIQFADHPDLRRLLTDYGFRGHPLRKDFPLTGHVEMRYDEEQKRVVYEPVRLIQDYRQFDFLSPWEGMTAALPGDDKVAGDDAGEAETEADGA
jgi:NADH-quinone oxidoreductase subunit C